MADEKGARSALDVARRILVARLDTTTTLMHVIKLTYLCHGWMLGIRGRPLIADDVVAWQYGPVVLSVYEQYKRWRGMPIRIEAGSDGGQHLFDPWQQGMIASVLKTYRNHSAFDLSAITHEKNTPWDIVYNGGAGRGCVIPNGIIRHHYQEKWKKWEARRAAG